LATKWPNMDERIVVLDDFVFGSGERLPQLRQNVITFGKPREDKEGRIKNAVLLLHNTTGSASTWLEPEVADELFTPGRALDAERYFLIAGDMIGFGKSTKPSDGMRARFPRYRYADMVKAQHRVLTEHFGVSHLRLVLGLSMGGMLTWMLGAAYPRFMDWLVPVASQPGPMSGRNWIQRRINIEAIRNDPGWYNGDYEISPSSWSLTAPLSGVMTQSVVRLQEMAPTREAADRFYQQLVDRAKKADANDRLFQLESSMDYDPSLDLHKIDARVFAINFADDQLNPPELGVLEEGVAKISGAQRVIVPASLRTNGHYTTMRAAVWEPYLRERLNSF
jgi:homoserine O-acetyltransferase/O-succinyltransferase